MSRGEVNRQLDQERRAVEEAAAPYAKELELLEESGMRQPYGLAAEIYQIAKNSNRSFGDVLRDMLARRGLDSSAGVEPAEQTPEPKEE